MTDYNQCNYPLTIDRVDIICGGVLTPPVYPCEICNKCSCDGEDSCKGFGAYILGIKLI